MIADYFLTRKYEKRNDRVIVAGDKHANFHPDPHSFLSSIACKLLLVIPLISA